MEGKNNIPATELDINSTNGKGFSKRYLAYFRLFYLTVNDIQILQTRLQNLTWSQVATRKRHGIVSL